MTTVAGVIVFKAKPGLGEEVARRVAAALPAVETERGTLLWLVLRSNADADRIFLVDLFDGEQSLTNHMNGDAASLIFATVPGLLAEDPEMHPSTVVAAKSTADRPQTSRKNSNQALPPSRSRRTSLQTRQ